MANRQGRPVARQQAVRGSSKGPRALCHRARGLRKACAVVVFVVIYLLAMTGVASAINPTVTIEKATSIGETTATLNASVNPEGKDTKLVFDLILTAPGEPTQCRTISEQEETYNHIEATSGQEAAEEWASQNIKWQVIEETKEQDAGAGTKAVKVNTTVSELEPGTKYCYEVIAYRGEPAEPGEEISPPEREEEVSSSLEALSTSGKALPPPAPSAGTQAATTVLQTSATLNGSVNPAGTETHYYFEYGQTTNYGSKTPVENAGSGNETQEVSATVIGLLPGTTYHYRLVASSSAGTSYGTDRTFTTEMLNTPDSAVREPRNENQWSFYVTSSGKIGEWAWTPSGRWQSILLSGGAQAAKSTNPIVVRNQQTGFMAVYYVASNGQIWNYNTNNAGGTSGWSSYALSGGGAAAAAGTSPSVTYNPVTGFTAVYYVGPSGQLWNYNWTAEHSWSAYALSGGGAAAASGTSPNAAYNPSTGVTSVYYVGPSSQLWNYNWTAEHSWSAYALNGNGAQAGAGITPSAVYNPSNGATNVYYMAWNEHMWHYDWTSEASWTAHELGETSEEVSTSSVANSAVREPRTGDIWSFYVTSSGGIDEWAWTPSSGWQSILLSGGALAAKGTHPIVVRNQQTGFMAVYYIAKGGQVWNYNTINATGTSGWSAYALSGGGAAAAAHTSPSVVYNPTTGFTAVYYVGSKGQLWNYNWTAEHSWSAYALSGGGAAAAADTSPSAVYNPSNSFTAVYYVGPKGRLWNYNWTSKTSWTAYALSGGGKPAEAYTSPSVVYNPTTGFTAVYYVGSKGQLWNYNWTAEHSWSAYALSGGGPAAEAGTSPSAVYNPNTSFTAVYYVGPNGQLWNYNWTAKTSWSAYALSGGGAPAASGTTPSVTYAPSTGFTAVYYIASNGQVWNYNWTIETSWSAYQL